MKKKPIGRIVLLALFWMTVLCGFSGESDDKIIDGANLWREEEEESLRSLVRDVKERIGADVAIVTTDDAKGRTTEAYAQWAYDYYQVGGEGVAGVLFLLDFDNREYYIDEYRPNGEAFEISDWERESMLDEIYPYMAEGEYAQACEVFLKGLERVMTNDERWEEDDREVYIDGQPSSKKAIGNVIGSSLLLSAVVSAVLVSVLVVMQNQKTPPPGAVYLKDRRSSLRQRKDIYTHTTTTRTRIQRNTPQGGRSSGSHRSGGSYRRGGGGGSHRGGGRNF